MVLSIIELKLLLEDEAHKAIALAPAKIKRFVGQAYKKVQMILNTLPPNKPATAVCINELEITQHMKDKLLDLIQKYKTNLPALIKERKHTRTLLTELTSVLGIGEKKAHELIEKGLKSVSQLLTPEWQNKISIETRLILKHKPVRVIPYEIIAKDLQPRLEFDGAILVGSFRRKKASSRDLDILLKGTDKKALDKYINQLKTRFTNVWIYANGVDRVSAIVDLRGKKYKVDVFRTAPDTYYSQLLYSTGSKEFNVRMRGKAKRMGMLLNQKGLFSLKSGKKLNKINDDERKLFELVGMRYLTPQERI